MSNINEAYANLFAAIWGQAVEDDKKKYKEIPLLNIQKSVHIEALKWNGFLTKK